MATMEEQDGKKSTVLYIAQEPVIPVFSGRDLQEFEESLDLLWELRPDITTEIRSRRMWMLLSPSVKRELNTQGLDSSTKVATLREALEETYGDRRSVSQLAVAFYSCSQESCEGVISFSQRLHQAFSALARAQRRGGAAPVEVAQLIERFLEGMRDSTSRSLARHYIMLKPQATFQELRREAERTEVEQLSPLAEKSSAVAARQVAEIADVMQEMAAELGKLRDLPAQLEAANRRIASLQASQTANHGDWRQPGCICHRCGDSGHIARACRVAVMSTHVAPACRETVPTHQPETTGDHSVESAATPRTTFSPYGPSTLSRCHRPRTWRWNRRASPLRRKAYGPPTARGRPRPMRSHGVTRARVCVCGCVNLKQGLHKRFRGKVLDPSCEPRCYCK